MTYHRTEAHAITHNARPRRISSPSAAKLRAAARFNLAASGVRGLPLSELPVKLSDLELSAPGSYGYAPLQERLARRYGVSTENVVSAIGTSMANYLAMATLLVGRLRARL